MGVEIRSCNPLAFMIDGKRVVFGSYALVRHDGVRDALRFQNEDTGIFFGSACEPEPIYRTVRNDMAKRGYVQ